MLFKNKHTLKILMCIDFWNRILVKLEEIQQATVRNTSSCLSVVYWPSSQNPQGYRFEHCLPTCSIWFLHFTQQLQLTIWSHVHRKHQRVHTVHHKESFYNSSNETKILYSILLKYNRSWATINNRKIIDVVLVGILSNSTPNTTHLKGENRSEFITYF